MPRPLSTTRTPPWWWRMGLCGWALAWAGALQAQALPADCAAHPPIPWQAVVPGVWAWPPEAPGDIDPGNQGHVATTSVVVDGGEALVVDPGPSHAHGWRVRQSLLCRFGARVRWVVNSHAHAENVLGNSAFADLQATGTLDIVASTGTLMAMRERCPVCLASLVQRLGEPVMHGTHTVLPNRGLAPGDVLRVGALAIEVLALEQGHTESDLLLWLARGRVLWAGGLVYEQRLPELAQGSLDGWLRALDHLERLRPQVVIHHAVSFAPDAEHPPAAMQATRTYLARLRQRVWQAMDAGRFAQEDEAVQMPEYALWAGYAERQSFNTQRAWRELEPLWFGAAAPPGGSAPDVRR